MNGTENKEWSTSKSSCLYKVDAWGAPYFSVNTSGNIAVHPRGLPHETIDLMKVLSKVTDPTSVGGLQLQLPLILRWPDILHHKIVSLNSAFSSAIDSVGYASRYQGVYPVKCNSDKHVVDDIVRFGHSFRFGLEAGSKAELLLAMSSLCKGHPEAFLVCNGFKDAEFVSLSLIARKMAINSVIVFEQEHEVDLVIRLSKKLGIRPVVGVRAKLKTKQSGMYGPTAGEKGKFGLTSIQILRIFGRLREENMLDCFKLLHFHIGSQIPTTALLAEAVAEAAHIYCELLSLGASMELFDVGGGLGIDYEGSKSSNSDMSVSYNIEEYAFAVVRSLTSVLNKNKVKHPVIISESGRAIVTHHSFIIFEALSPKESPLTEPLTALGLREGMNEEILGDYTKLTEAVRNRDDDAIGFYANQLKQKSVALFKQGLLKITQMAMVEWICEDIQREKGARTYNINLSIFSSMPDAWSVDQLFPIIPVHRLQERPSVFAKLYDLTCDCDGMIKNFIIKDSHFPLHDIGDAKYYLGMFFHGAYEEVISGVYNLFAGHNIVRVNMEDESGSFSVTPASPCLSCSDILRVMKHEPDDMLKTIKLRIKERFHDNRIDALISIIEQSFDGNPYLNT